MVVGKEQLNKTRINPTMHSDNYLLSRYTTLHSIHAVYFCVSYDTQQIAIISPKYHRTMGLSHGNATFS
jgi:hypothetical protein